MVLLFLGLGMNSKISQLFYISIKFESLTPQIFGLQYDQIVGALPPRLSDMNIITKCYKNQHNKYVENGSKINPIQMLTLIVQLFGSFFGLHKIESELCLLEVAYS